MNKSNLELRLIRRAPLLLRPRPATGERGASGKAHPQRCDASPRRLRDLERRDPHYLDAAAARATLQWEGPSHPVGGKVIEDDFQTSHIVGLR